MHPTGWYLRYCDDFVLLADSPEQLVAWRAQIESWLCDELCLKLNPRQVLAPVSNGVNFLGYIVRRDYLLVRRRVVNHLRERLAAFEKRLVTDGPGWRRYRFDTAVLDELAAVLASYWGHFRLADSFNLRQSLWRRHPFLRQFFAMGPDAIPDRRDQAPPGVRGAASQYRHFRRRFPGDVLFFQVGKFVEFYQPDDARVAARLGLSPMTWNRRGARFGFPARDAGNRLGCVLRDGQSVVLIRETGARLQWNAARAPIFRFENRAGIEAKCVPRARSTWSRTATC